MGLNVLRMSERIPPLRGGKEIHVAELTRAQVDAGHELLVLYRSGDGRTLGAPAVRVGMPAPLTGLRGLTATAVFSAAAARSARALKRPDLIHAHGDLAEAWCMARYARRVGAPVVLTIHGGLNPRYARLSRYAFGGIDAFIVLGDRVRDDLRRCGVQDDRVTVMSSGLNTDLIAAAQRGAAREPGLIVTVGSLDAVKNVAVVVRAVLGAPQSLDLSLDVIGDGPQRKELEAITQGSPRVRFLGQLSRDQVYRRVAAADAFVIASRRLPGKGEGVPTALLEAMALGRLSLVSIAARPQPVVTDEGSYRTFDPDDQAQLAALLVEAVTDPVTRGQVGARARAAVAHLGWPDVARRVDDVYHRARSAHRLQR